MTNQQSAAEKSEINAVIETEDNAFNRLMENPMGQAVFASLSTISLFGFVLSGIWLVNTIVN